MVVLRAHVSIKRDARERWLSLVEAVSAPSRAEDACRSYRVYENVETPESFFVEAP